MRRIVHILVAVSVLLVAFVGLSAGAPPAGAGPGEPTRYYLSLGNSLAASAQPNGDDTHGYAEQLHATLAASDPTLKLVKLGCGGESAQSMRFGFQDPSIVLSCGPPAFYEQRYPEGTQLAQAVKFLEKNHGKIALVTIDIGANDMQHIDANGQAVFCVFEPSGCDARTAAMAAHLAVILAELHAAAPDVPIYAMTYYNVFAPLADPTIDAQFDVFNSAIASTYTNFGVPVADVAGAFHNGEQPLSARLVCRWTWFCSVGDVHPNTIGYRVIAKAFLDVIQP